jgi:myo-inositol-1(or 4)-monophosphatase
MFRIDQVHHFLSALRQHCSRWSGPQDLNISTKADLSQVTEVDQLISEFVKSSPLADGFHFYSEEEHGELVFPALILDPLDGTRDFLKSRPECAVSAAWMKSPFLNADHFAVVFNPFTGFTIDSTLLAPWQPKPQLAPWTGMVSRTEWENGLYPFRETDNYQIIPRGSIAFKLALLASGGCDFVVSLRPKNVWDIAAGTLLAKQRGIEFWSAGKKIESLDATHYSPPLIWATPEKIPVLTKSFSR